MRDAAGSEELMKRQSVVVAVAVTATLLGASADAAIRIKKIAFDPPGKDGGTNRRLNKEWILIENTGEQSRALDDWVVRDRGDHRFRFPSYAGEEIRWVLPAGDLVKLHSGTGRPRTTDGCGGGLQGPPLLLGSRRVRLGQRR
ncbi:MAG: lamin tail domain-containing protein [Actinomycetota bacterium]